MTATLDCLIVGGGPAGLTAAIYLARFRLRTLVIDAGEGRAATIPRTRNLAGFPGGISGADLLERMTVQAREFGARIQRGRVSTLKRMAAGFEAGAGRTTLEARRVLLATGVSNNRPDMPAALHDRALAEGRLRYCPVCDGFEIIDQAVAVIGTGAHAADEAQFIRSYTSNVTLVAPDGPHRLSALQRRGLDRLGIAMVDGPPADFVLDPSGLGFTSAGGRHSFEAVYPALGSIAHTDLAAALGAKLCKERRLVVDRHQRTSVSGLYAAGDAVGGLDQISHAMGEACVAATAIRNDLAACQTGTQRPG